MSAIGSTVDDVTHCEACGGTLIEEAKTRRVFCAACGRAHRPNGGSRPRLVLIIGGRS
jgi:uncharacterized Zn finger protein (UPF0148 family)